MTSDDVEDDTYDVILRPGKFVTLKRADPLTLFMTGALNASLQVAVDKAHALLNSLNEPAPSLDLLSMPQGDRDEIMEVMREYACAVCIVPGFTKTKASEPTKADVYKLTMQELLTIFNAVPTGLKYPRLTGVQAVNFRPPVLPADDQAPPAGPDVSGSPIRLATVNGIEVEAIGA